MASAPFCAADENDIVVVKARVVGNFGDWLQVEFVGGNQVTKVFVGAGDVVTTIPDRVADAAMRYQIASLRRSHTR